MDADDLASSSKGSGPARHSCVELAVHGVTPLAGLAACLVASGGESEL